MTSSIAPDCLSGASTTSGSGLLDSATTPPGGEAPSQRATLPQAEAAPGTHAGSRPGVWRYMFGLRLILSQPALKEAEALSEPKHSSVRGPQVQPQGAHHAHGRPRLQTRLHGPPLYCFHRIKAREAQNSVRTNIVSSHSGDHQTTTPRSTSAAVYNMVMDHYACNITTQLKTMIFTPLVPYENLRAPVPLALVTGRR